MRDVGRNVAIDRLDDVMTGDAQVAAVVEPIGGFRHLIGCHQ